MQKQAQVAGQHGQPSPLVRAGFQPLRRNLPGWRNSEDDTNLRYQIISHISRLGQQRGSENKIAQIAYDVESALYLGAVSKEEYGDLNTLEQRIYSLFIRLRNNPNSAQNGAQLGSVLSNTAMVPIPGCSDSTAIPLGLNTDFSTSVTGRSLSKKDGSRFLLNTGGSMAASVHDINSVGPAAGFSDNLFASAIEQAPSSSLCGSYPEKNTQLISGIGMTRPGSQMIPTPGINVRSPPAKLAFHNASELSSSSAGLSFYNASDTSINNLKQQQLTKGSGCQIFGGMNAQYNGMFSSNQLGNVRMPSGVQITGHDQVLATGASGHHASYQSNTKQSVLQAYPQYSHHAGQALPLHRLYGDGYALNATDLAESGSVYNAVFATGLGVRNTNVGSLVSAPSKMVPVPGLLSERQDFLMSQRFQPQRGSGYYGSDSLQSPGLSGLPQQQQQQARSLVIPNQCDVKECGTNLLNAHLQPPLRSLPDQKTSGVLAGEQCQSHAQRDQLSFLPHVQTEQVSEARGNQDTSRMEQDQMDLGKQLHLPPDGLKLGHICPLGSSADQQVELSEETCQASSADTGQSEVVSNDESLAPRQVNGVGSSIGIQEVKKQQWLLVFLRHVSRCTNSEQCAVPQCEVGCRFWKHITTCQVSQCSYPRCVPLKRLLKHHDICRNSKCVVCGPVRNYFSRRSKATKDQIGKGPSVLLSASLLRASAANEVESPPVKRLKVEVTVPNVSQASQQPQQSVSTVESEEQTSFQDTLSTPKDECVQSLPVTKPDELQTSNRPGKNKIGLSSLKIDSPTGSSLSAGSHLQGHTKVRLLSNIKLESDCMKEDSALQVAGPANIQTSQDAAKHVTVVSTVTNLNISSEIVKPAKTKIPGTSYLEIFTPQEIRDHISSLRKWIGQSKGKAERNQAMEHQMAAGACSACAVETLAFDPTPIFCTHCGCRIKRNSTYHTTGSGENSQNFCGPCYNAIRADTLETCGLKVQKSTLEKKKNDEQRIEAWVECDKCKKWQHQICVLFNARINKERSEYTCPECCIAEMERCERVPLPTNSVLGTKDLPTTILSDHVEERLALRLEQERVERARALGKSPEEVPTAEGLVVRVVSSVEKKLEVKQRFLDMFQQEEYPKDFLYKSKMLLLFQKIEGVEVCLFGMYVQEFGAECPQPNRRHVYLSYLDSVKYFRPDVKTVTGEALRTFVYHEILIAYLDYSKKRGFSSCYIWACPPLKGDDYILYCHPEIQKTPKTDKLREWYLSMIAKAKKENIVVANKNLYDYYFTSNCECKAKITAARLPYFDGDYWPGAAEDILQQLQEQEEGLHSQRRGKAKKVAPKRSSKTSAHAELAGNESRDLQLMHKLGQSIVAMKEDFIMVHMHHACAHCHNFITSGHRWFCRQCAGNFQLCDCCYEEHQKLGEEERHPAGKKEWHPLVMEEVDDVPADTSDKDEIMESEFFDHRQAFLNLCQGNQYQYDTLRRAKHSSMMVLYHLHNPNAPAFITSCSICHTEIEMGQGWKCKSCLDYDVCNLCLSSQEVQRHPHKLVARPAAADQSAANKDARQHRMLQLRTMLELLVHASQCRQLSCQYGKCKNMKDLFRHAKACTKRITGGCSLCKRMWFLLTSHARSCKETRCIVPRCMDLREHARRMQVQQESRRRAAVNEMIRQRAAEAAGAS